MSGRIVLITGAASGIGAATALRLAGVETALVVTTRGNMDGLTATVDAARAKGAQVLAIQGDLTEAGFPEDLVTQAVARFGGLDQIVSNAGRAKKGAFGDIKAADLEDAISVNAMPFFHLITAALPRLKASPWGRVVAISSFVTTNFGASAAPFTLTAAAKGALENLALSLAYQLAPDGVPVNCVSPGFTRKVGGHAALSQAAWDAAAQTTPDGRLAEPDDIAAAVEFLLSREARHITGQILRVDGGLSLR